MATTKIWPIRDSLKRVLDYAENPDKTGYLGLRQVLEYAEDANKTGEDDEFETCYHITGVNCMVKTAFEEMTAVNSKKPVRLYQLGKEYDLPKLQERLEENRDWFHFDRSYPRYQPNPKPPRPRVYHMRSSFFSAKKVGGLRGLYWHWCYLLGIFPKGNRRKHLSPEMRQEVRKLEQYTREFDLIHRYQLYSVEKVQAFVADRDRELAQLTDERDRYSNQLRYLTLPEEASAMKALRDSMTKRAKALRKELSTARAILAGVQEKQRLISNEQQMMRPPAQVTREKGVRRNEER